MRRLYFGGSFNPIHHGHLIVAMAVAEAQGYDRVTLIPSAQPPHKARSADLASPADRLAMCQRAAVLSDLFEVDDVELHRSGPSYTIDTARYLTSRDHKPIDWLIGMDTVPLLKTWHKADALLEEINFVVVARPGSLIDWAGLSERVRRLEKNVLNAPEIDISATTIRRRVRAGKSIQFLTPDPVVRYIEASRLYLPSTVSSNVKFTET